ncbi:CopG family transcriptional regulator [Arsukibacterium perlucidum]|uniref:ribbon-helix-helix domain-containing protein n=1 Tax=Arsukibacterium perlucidum TaxID=368811 RepID=UPI000360C975|nr:CopG family transcriptional regulator [Arsukibacterium perlucidum]
MAQITIYLDDELIQQVKQSAAQAKVSQSQWIADLIRQNFHNDWPLAVREMAGSWQVFPQQAEIRVEQGKDIPREPL